MPVYSGVPENPSKQTISVTIIMPMEFSMGGPRLSSSTSIQSRYPTGFLLLSMSLSGEDVWFGSPNSYGQSSKQKVRPNTVMCISGYRL
jgi:hypothetical protein